MATEGYLIFKQILSSQFILSKLRSSSGGSVGILQFNTKLKFREHYLKPLLLTALIRVFPFT